MAPIEPDEVEAGLVAFVDPTWLAAADGVVSTKDPPTSRSGPFVCISVESDTSQWMPLTTEFRRERLEIKLAWRSGGHPQWMRDAQYLNDGANVWLSPTESFIDASLQELTGRASRARVSEQGLTAIAREVAKQRHRRDRQ